MFDSLSAVLFLSMAAYWACMKYCIYIQYLE
jgi:hypothetical protein